MKRYLLLLVFAIVSQLLLATDFYYAQSSAGSNTGTSCANAWAYTDATNGINNAGKWIGDNTLHLCGTFTVANNTVFITGAGSGTSGHPITLQWESGAIVQSGYWPTTGGIVLDNLSYITINGGTNGVFQATANGSSLANQIDSVGISINNTSHITFQNGLNVNNLYVRTPGTSGSAGFNNGCISGTNATNLLVDGLSFVSCRQGVGVLFTVNGDGYEVRNSYFYDVEVPTVLSTGTANAVWTSAYIHGNHFAGYIYTGVGTSWDDTTSNSFHHDGGGHYWAQATNAHITDLYFYNNLTDGVWGNDPAYYTSTSGGTHITSWVYPEETGGRVWIFNDVFDLTAGDARYQSGDNGTIFCKGASQPSYQCLVYNNLILGQTGNSSFGTGFETDNNTGDIVKNNIFVNLGMAYYFAGGANSTVTADYNFYYNIGASGWNFGSYAAWQPGNDSHSPSATNVSPNLAANYHPNAGSPVVGAANNLSSLGVTALNSDKAGVARPGGTTAWDMGAFQYTGAPPAASPAPAPMFAFDYRKEGGARLYAGR